MGSEFDDIDCSGGADVAPLVGEDEETVENSVGALDAENRVGGDDGMVENSIARDSVAFEGGTILEPVEGMEFESEEAAKVFYNSYARHVGFSIRASTIHRSMRDGNIISRNFVCSKEGFRQEKHLNNENRIKRPRAITREGCKAMLMVKKIGIGKWVVKKFVRDHNHAMVSPAQVQYLRSHRSSSTVQHPVTVGVRPSFIMPVSSEESGGICNVDVSERDCKSYIGPDRQKTLGRGDSQAVLDYFKSMQAENPAFFYAVQVDEEDRMTDFFWVDARSRMAYHYFGDVVTFDTTYMMSRCRMPFAPFVGVNHHQQPVSFGCALLLDETESSFVWLFNTWLEAMSGRHPISIITDQDQPIEAAVARVFPGARHRFCLRNILRKAAEKLSDVYHTHEKFKDEFYQCIQTMETIDEFESCWGLLHARYDIRDNEWVQSLYNIRHQWVPSYLRNTFFAEIPTTQQSESIKPFFDGNVNSNMTLVEFVKQYARTLDGRYEKEIHADFETIHTQPILKTQLPMEKQAAHIYTRTIFTRFQEELFESLCYIAEKIEDNRVISTYRVAKFGDEKRAYTVKLNVSETSASCSCQMFEFSGILCKHVLIVFRMTNILMLPPYYILKRWTRNAKSGMVLGERGIGMQGDCSESLTLRYNDLCHQAIKFAEDGATSADIYRVALCALQKAFEEVVAAKRPVVRVDQLSTPISRNIRQENISESEADSSSNQKKIKQYNINIANDNYTRGNSGIGGFTSTGPNDLHSPGSASAEGFGLSTRNLSMMNSQCKGKDCLGWAARDASGLLSPYTFKLRIPGNDDISLKITHCGVCHADITSIKNKLGNSKYPLVPGHEIVGTVTEIGCNVSRFKIGDHIGVGTYVNSCRECEWCNDRLEVHCVKGPISTFNGIDGDGTITKGGFSSHIVVHERYCYKIPENYPLALAAPLMCAGITVYAPMVRHKMNQPSKSLGVIGLGGLGHLAVKFGKAFGLHVTVFSTSISKNVEAEILGADKFVLSSDKEQMAAMKKSLDFIIDIASGGRSFDIYLPVLKTAGVLVLLGFPSEIRFNPSTLNLEMRTISGSLSGGTKDTQEMLDFCAAHDIYPEIEVIKIQDINDALDRLLSREVKHRFMVIDMEKSAK